MKLKINREITIGLSVLAVLLVALGAVVVHRFMRPHVPPDALAKAEEKAREERPVEHLKRVREAESLPKPLLLPPAETPHGDRLHHADNPGNWNLKEPNLIASNPHDSAKLDGHEGERITTCKAPELPPATTEELRAKERSNSMVVQVSDGEMKDGAPPTLDRPHDFPGGMPPHAETVHREAEKPRDQGFPGSAMPIDPDAGAPGTPGRREAEKSREHGFPGGGMPVDRPAAGSTFSGGASPSGPAPRYGYSSAPLGDGASNYAAAPSGYQPDNSLHRGDPEYRVPQVSAGVRPQNRLRDDGTYEVQPNDSYWTISERVYGSGAYFRALAEQNRGKAARPDRLPPGLVISTPPVAQLEKDYPDLCPRPSRRESVRNRADQRSASGFSGAAALASTAGGGRTYVVQEGDTLSSIARNELGKVSRWAEIYQLNREALGRDYDYLTPGMRLALPLRDSPSGDRTARRSEDDAPQMR